MNREEIIKYLIRKCYIRELCKSQEKQKIKQYKKCL